VFREGKTKGIGVVTACQADGPGGWDAVPHRVDQGVTRNQGVTSAAGAGGCGAEVAAAAGGSGARGGGGRVVAP